MKSNNYSKILNKIFTIIFACTTLGAQEGEVIEITKDIGYTLDAEENLHYEIFTDIPNFESAQFFEMSRNRIEVRISFVEFTQIKISKRAFDLKEFSDLQFRLKQMPTITDDIRESPAIAVVNELLNSGSKIKAYDPSISDIFTKGSLPDSFDSIVRHSSAIEAATDADALVILTEWNEFKGIDLLELKEKMTSPIIFDGRNIYDSKLIRGIGFEYHGIGLR